MPKILQEHGVSFSSRFALHVARKNWIDHYFEIFNQDLEIRGANFDLDFLLNYERV